MGGQGPWFSSWLSWTWGQVDAREGMGTGACQDACPAMHLKWDRSWRSGDALARWLVESLGWTTLGLQQRQTCSGMDELTRPWAGHVTCPSAWATGVGCHGLWQHGLGCGALEAVVEKQVHWWVPLTAQWVEASASRWMAPLWEQTGVCQEVFEDLGAAQAWEAAKQREVRRGTPLGAGLRRVFSLVATQALGDAASAAGDLGDSTIHQLVMVG